MSDIFFEEFGLPVPTINFGVNGDSHAIQTGKIMIEYERICKESPPDLTIVVGDVNSSLACALAAKKLEIKVAHLEAGLRSYDRRMPEEINRVIIDSISDILWTPSFEAFQNLVREGVEAVKIEFVGNIMIDAFERLKEQIISQDIMSEYGLKKNKYLVVTIHRPSNTDSKEMLSKVINEITSVAKRFNVVFPMHPRTLKSIEKFDLINALNSSKIKVVPAQSYIKFMSLVLNSYCVITDSGGVQEETSYLGIPCLTVRESTERPITITMGTNRLVSLDEINTALDEITQNQNFYCRKLIDKWDGLASSRILESIKNNFCD
jgi:UDP-N-acetylglucosamine 2-epimerase (non-hydrolysing)